MTGDELERAAAAVLQASGWFVLRGATDETFQAFELDVVGYRFYDGEEASVVVESKGGRSGFNHLWKLVGLKAHLEIQQGVLLADESEPLHARKVELARRHDVAVISQDPVDLADEFVKAGVVAQEPDPAVLLAWRRCFRVEDALAKVLNDKRLWAEWTTIQLAKKQLQQLTSKVWLEPDPWRQAIRLYKLFQDEPKIARRMAREMSPGQSNQAMNAALYYGSLPEVQACFYLEHRKRLSVAFAATRCAAVGSGGSRYARLAPASFRSMVDTITDEGAWYLPALLQVYFLGFGSMVCLDSHDEEFNEMASQAGCSAPEARRGLELFQELFWTAGGWFHERAEISILKLVPYALRGAGLWMREAVYERPWEEAATEDQFAAVGQRHLEHAKKTESEVMPQRRRTMRRLGRRSSGN